MSKIKSRNELVSEIAYALQTHLDEGSFYLNLTDQDVGFSAPAALVGEDCVWPREGDEVIDIDPLESWERCKSMEHFANEQPPKIADKLFRAMNGSRPFARFKAAVDILDLLQEWYAFKNQWYERKAEDWMHFHEVDFVDGKIVTKSNTVIWDGEDDEWGGEDDEWDDDDV